MRRGYTVIEVLTVVVIASIILFVVFLFSGSNFWAKTFGGTVNVELPAEKKLVNASWKDNNLWALVREAQPGEKAETYTYQEFSNLGVLQGKVVFKEKIKTLPEPSSRDLPTIPSR